MVITDTTMMRLLLLLALLVLAQALAGCDGARRVAPPSAQGSSGAASSLPAVGSVPRSLGTTGGAAFAASKGAPVTLGSGGASPTVR